MIVGGEKEIGDILGGQPTSGAVNVPVTPSAYVRSGHLSLAVGHPLDWLTLPNPKRLRLELSAELICCWAGHFRQSQFYSFFVFQEDLYMVNYIYTCSNRGSVVLYVIDLLFLFAMKLDLYTVVCIFFPFSLHNDEKCKVFLFLHRRR